MTKLQRRGLFSQLANKKIMTMIHMMNKMV